MLLFLLIVSACGKKGDPTLVPPFRPPSPSALTGMHREDKTILMWKFSPDEEANINGFIVMRSTDSTFKKIGAVEKGGRHFIDPDIEINRLYRYKVLSADRSGLYSKDSDILSITPSTLPGRPADLSFEIKDTNINLKWKGVLGEDIRYRIYRRFNNNEYGLSPLVTTSAEQYQDTMDLSKSVSYVVRAIHQYQVMIDEGNASDEITINPAELIPPAPKDVDFFITPEKTYLFWKPADESWISGYRIFKKTPDSDFKLIGFSQVPAYLDISAPAKGDVYRVHVVGPLKEGPGTLIEPKLKPAAN